MVAFLFAAREASYPLHYSPGPREGVDMIISVVDMELHRLWKISEKWYDHIIHADENPLFKIFWDEPRVDTSQSPNFHYNVLRNLS